MFEIKLMQIEHLKDVYKISKEQFDKGSWSLSQFTDEMIDCSREAYIIELNKKTIAFLNLMFTPDEVSILNLAVLKEFKRKGFGKKLMLFAIERAKEKKISKITLEVDAENSVAINLYTKLGFKKTRVRKKYYNNGNDCVEMQFILNKR